MCKPGERYPIPSHPLYLLINQENRTPIGTALLVYKYVLGVGEDEGTALLVYK
jgi:hypothetical protein